jgi:hypothetical protein
LASLSGKISIFARQREIARTRESATAAEGGTHVYLNRKMVQELLAEMGESPRPTLNALSGLWP